MTTLGEAVAAFGPNPQGGLKAVAEALRVPVVVVENVVQQTEAGQFCISCDIKEFQVSPMDAAGMDANVVAYVDQKARQWQGAMEVTMAQRHAILAAAVHQRVDALEHRTEQLERDLSAARLRNARLHDEVDALKMALGGAQTLISAGPHQRLTPESLAGKVSHG